MPKKTRNNANALNSKKQPNSMQKQARRSKKISKQNNDLFGPSIPQRTVVAIPKKSTGTVSLSPCAIRYALAVSDPFHPQAKKACVPVYPSPPSLKTSAVTRFNMSIGTAGVGFATFAPVLSSDSVTSFYTTTAFTGTAILPLSATDTLTTGVVTAALPLPFNTAGLLPTTGSFSVSGRVVSYGVRATYIGTTLNESGTLYCYTAPAHDNIIPYGSSTASLGAVLDTVVTAVNRESCELSIFATGNTETAYATEPPADSSAANTSYVYPFCQGRTSMNSTFTITGTGSVKVGSPCSCIMATGVAGSSFLIELITHVEYTGPSAIMLATTTDADVRGFEIVQAAANQMALRKIENPKKTPWQHILDGIKETAHALKPVAIDALIRYGTAILA
jgi:hypothetical protein